jgi:ATP-dependent helicase/nuclease subunit B
MNPVALPVADLWTLLDASRASPVPGAVLVCATHRIAQAYVAADAARQASAGRTAWTSASIIPVDRFLRAGYDQAAQRGAVAGRILPAVLEPSQERAIWRGIVEQSGTRLLRGGEAARLCAAAWRLVRDWQLPLPLPGAASNADVAQFNDWGGRFQRRLQSLDVVDTAGLPGALVSAARDGFAIFPRTIVLAGFEQFTPALKGLLVAMNDAGITIHAVASDERHAHVERAMAADAERELRAAASWARDNLEGGAMRIGIVVPDARARRGAIERIFAEVLPPGAFSIAVGEPLGETSMIQCALRLLGLRAGATPIDEITALLLSPYWGGDETHREARARVDFKLRKEGHLAADLSTLASVAAGIGAVELAEICRRLLMLRPPASKMAPSAWAQHFAEWLDVAGWPGVRAADAREQDCRRRWVEGLGEFAALGAVLPSLPLSSALAHVREIADHTVQREAAPSARVQIMAPRDSAGLAFERLWVAGLDDQAWPRPARPNPLIPFGLQRDLRMPECDAAWQLDEATRLTRGWLAGADEVVFSHALHEDDRELQGSPLIPDAPERMLEQPSVPSTWTQAFAARRLETIDDANGAPTGEGEVLRGGARLFGDQAACPFRAYAHFRLGAEPVPEPAFSLDDRDRGNLTHRALHILWDGLRTHAALLALTSDERRARVERAVDRAIEWLLKKAAHRLGAAMARLERARLVTLLVQWLEREAMREPFDVLQVEGAAPGEREPWRTSNVEGVELKIRPDRIDRLADGRTLVIDYKTGDVLGRPWKEERPDQPQLLLYALERNDAAGITFAKVRTGDLEWRGVADEPVVKGVDSYQSDAELAMLPSWQALLDLWRRRIALLGAEIRAGVASVLPKSPRMCDTCDLHSVCRVRESVAELHLADDVPEAA